MPTSERQHQPGQRVNDWLDSGVVALSGFVPPGSAATRARQWSRELEVLSNGRVRVDGARLLAERAAITGGVGQDDVSVGGACRMVHCADGWLAVSLPRPSDLDLIEPLTEGPVGDPWEALQDWARRHSGAEVVDRARLLGIALSRVGVSAVSLELPAASATPAPASPLVVDFSALWAGPLCASLLGLAGARVVKVESAARLDGARRGDSDFYDLLHTGQQSICVVPELPEDRALLRALVAAADVVVESSRPRALEGWGLSAAEAAANGTVWVSVTAYGRGQPDRIGFGDDVAAGAGLVGCSKEPEGPPRFVGDAIADPLTGLAAAVAALRALGSASSGQLIDLSMASVVAATLDDTRSTSADGLIAAVPQARKPQGQAPAAGADTDSIRAEFG